MPSWFNFQRSPHAPPRVRAHGRRDGGSGGGLRDWCLSASDVVTDSGETMLRPAQALTYDACRVRSSTLGATGSSARQSSGHQRASGRWPVLRSQWYRPRIRLAIYIVSRICRC